MTETSTLNTTGTAQATPAKPQKRTQNARTARPRVLSAMQDLSVSRENIEKELQKRQTRRNNPCQQQFKIDPFFIIFTK